MVAAAWSPTSPCAVSAASVASRIAVLRTPLRPAAVSTSTLRMPPTEVFGHLNVTSVGEAARTGTRLPLTRTAAPANSRLWLDQSDVVAEESHPPRNVASDAGEHTSWREPVTLLLISSITGSPVPARTSTSAETESSPSEAEKVRVETPAWDSPGTH